MAADGMGAQISSLKGMSTIEREILAPDVVERTDDFECDSETLKRQ